MVKKVLVVITTLALVVCGVFAAIKVFNIGSKPDGTVDTPELGEISGFTQEQLNTRLVELMQEEIYHSWGGPDETFPEHDVWYLDSDGKEKVILYYDDNRCVSDIVFERDE